MATWSGGLRAAIITSARSEQKSAAAIAARRELKVTGMIDLICVLLNEHGGHARTRVATLATVTINRIEQLTLLCSILVPLY